LLATQSGIRHIFLAPRIMFWCFAACGHVCFHVALFLVCHQFLRPPSGAYASAIKLGMSQQSLSDRESQGLLQVLWLFFFAHVQWPFMSSWFADKMSEQAILMTAVTKLLEPNDEDEKIQMSLSVQVHAYWGYLRLFLSGIVRESAIRLRAAVWRDAAAVRYIQRTSWNADSKSEFYFQHMYKPILDCFSRPISSAPDACVDVVTRTRRGGWFFPALYAPECTSVSQRCVNLSSYNYLGFGGVDEFCTPAARASMLEHGFSTSGTRTQGGTAQIHLELEQQVASFLDKEDAIVLSMGFATNSTILPALLGGEGVLVLSDELNHRSIVEGVRLSGATVRAFKHSDMEVLEQELRKAVEQGQGGAPWRKIFVVVEGIYSMEGDFTPLQEVVALKNLYNAYLYLDEAHSIGAVGATGRGVTELLDVPRSEVDVMMGTFTKSFGSAGGYVASSKAVIDTLRRDAPGSVFAFAMPPPCAAQALAALRVISGTCGGSTGSKKLAQIRDNSNFFREALEAEGFKVLGASDSPIIPVMLHHSIKMGQFSRRCLQSGIAVVIVGYPAVPVLYERVRFCISAAHTREQLTSVVQKVTAIGRELGVLYNYGSSTVLPARDGRSRKPQPAMHSFVPEPLAQPSVTVPSVVASTSAEPHSTKDFRRFDPLGYAQRPLLAAQRAGEATMNEYGFGACGPRGFYGSTRPHMELEATITRCLGVDAAIVYSAGVATASSVIPALVMKGDHVIVDSQVHLGILTGLRLCRADVSWVAQGDVDGVARVLASTKKSVSKGRQSRTFVVVEGVSQRTGRVAPLEELVALKQQYGALLIVDETLSFGTLGSRGLGLSKEFGSHVDAIIGSLEHAAAVVGGFCAGRGDLIEHQRLAGAGYCFSASCPPAACSMASATIMDLSDGESSQRLARLRSNASLLHEMLRSAELCGEHVQAISSPESYVQHLWFDSHSELACAIVERVVATGFRVQLCNNTVCPVEDTFRSKLKAPALMGVSLRICASAESSVQDIITLTTSIREVLAAR